MEKKCIIVSYEGGLNGDLDNAIMRTAKKCRLEHDGTGYDLVKHVRDHFIYSSDPVRIRTFRSAIAKLSELSAIKLKVKVTKAA
jgi:hypothetical protein